METENKTMSRLVGLAVTLTVSIIMIASLVVPLINDYSDDRTYEYTNMTTNVVRADLYEISDIDNMLLTVTYDDVLTIHYNDLDQPVSTWCCYLASDAFNLRSYGTLSGFFTASGVTTNIVPSSTDNNVITLSVSGGMATLTYHPTASSSVTIQDLPITWLAMQNSTGDNVIMLSESATRTIYYTDINNVRGANWINTTSEWYSFKGLDVNVGGESITADLVNVKTLAGDGHSFVYSSTLGDYTFNVDNSGEDYTVHPYVFVTDYLVTAVTPSDSSQIAVMAAIPTMLIVALLVMVTNSYRAKNE